MDFVQELRDQEQELRKVTRSTVLIDSWEIEHEETPLEVGYQDQSADLWKNLWKTHQSVMKQSGGLIPYSDEMISSAVSSNS